jgi:hypothetical protein
MDDLLLNKEWFRCPDGYGLEHSPERKDTRGGLGERIVAHSRNIVSYRPFAQYDMLWSAFAEVKSTDDLVRFLQKFGPLEVEWFLRPVESQDIERALTWAGEFRALLRAKAGGSRKVAKTFRSQRLADLQARLKYTGDLNQTRSHVKGAESFPRGLPLSVGYIILEEDPVSGIKIVVRPESLISGLWVQLARKLAGPAVTRNCRFCGSLFEAGPGTSRRSDATFCSSDHSVRFYSLQRSRGGMNASSERAHS